MPKRRAASAVDGETKTAISGKHGARLNRLEKCSMPILWASIVPPYRKAGYEAGNRAYGHRDRVE